MAQQIPDPKEMAKNLRKPEGDFGKKVGEFMNKGNASTYERMKKHLALKGAPDLLEIGFGNGVTSKEIMQNSNYSGLDYSQDMVNTAANLCASEIQNGAKLFCGDIHQMPFADKSFDIVLTINTIYFWDQPVKAVAELRRVTKENGRLLIGMRTKEDMDALSNITSNGFNIRPLAEVEYLLRNGGFKNIQYTVYADPLGQRPDGKVVQLHSVIFEAS
ncbi:MAG: class I SAM-dependent methyltransferase [Bacteroidetes bacterium]|nr:class I SAM-dependent methyltransferase [Bacteroidota bacterium]